jgi:hypothetical protein
MRWKLRLGVLVGAESESETRTPVSEPRATMDWRLANCIQSWGRAAWHRDKLIVRVAQNFVDKMLQAHNESSMPATALDSAED